MARFSILTPTLNSIQTLEDHLKSVASQSYGNYEHIIIDGGSDDGTLEVLQNYNLHAIKLLKQTKRSGIYGALNLGVRAASGEYVIFLNSDDVFYTTETLKNIEQALNSRFDLVYGNVFYTSSLKDINITRYYRSNSFKPWMLRYGIMPAHPGMTVRRALCIDIGGFDQTYRIAGDFDFLKRLFANSEVSYKALDAPLVYMRDRGVSNSGFRSKRIIYSEINRSLRVSKIGLLPLRALVRIVYKMLLTTR